MTMFGWHRRFPRQKSILFLIDMHDPRFVPAAQHTIRNSLRFLYPRARTHAVAESQTWIIVVLYLMRRADPS